MPKLRMNADVGFVEMTVQDSEQNLSFPLLLIHPLDFSSGKHPLVMISHGSGGSPLAYRWLADYLAKNGYFVGIPEYPFNNRHDNSREGTIENLIDRPRHLRLAIDAIFADERWSSSLKKPGVALIGHSMGGYTSLVLAGGIPHTQHQIKYDPDHKIKSSQEVPVKSDDRVNALVLLAPATGWFLSEGALSKVKAPLLILTGEFDDITPAFHAEILKKGISNSKQVTHREIRNASHYSFLGVFPESVRKTNFAPAMDRPGFDRPKFHDELNVEILEFLQNIMNGEDE